VDPAALLEGMREVLGQTLGPGVTVRVEAPAGLPPLLADKGQLETVLINLATNARDAMPDGGELTFAAALETVAPTPAPNAALTAGPYVRLSVTDTGMGMPPDMLARVVEPFFTTKGEGKGTGLGLALAKGFAEQSGGALHIDSAPGRGTTVALWFPLAPVVAASPRARRAIEPPAAAQRRRARILLVDDEPIVRELTAEQLRGLGLTVLAVTSGPAALALLDSGEPVDLMISDLGMPGMDGLALIREARRRRNGLPAILLTGSLGAAPEQAAGDSVTVVRKPVTAAQLAERLATALDGAADARGAR
jgi:CheY-like chemotaxis protein